MTVALSWATCRVLSAMLAPVSGTRLTLLPKKPVLTDTHSGSPLSLSR